MLCPEESHPRRQFQHFVAVSKPFMKTRQSETTYLNGLQALLDVHHVNLGELPENHGWVELEGVASEHRLLKSVLSLRLFLWTMSELCPRYPFR